MFTTDFLLIALIIFFSSFSMGFSGFGFALISVPLISLIAGITYASPLSALGGIVVNLFLVLKFRKTINFKELTPLYISSFIAIPIGVYALSNLNLDFLRVVLGCFLIVYLLISVFNLLQIKNVNDKWSYLAGFLSGLFGGLFNTNGPPVLIYFLLKGYNKEKFKASIAGYFIFNSIIIISWHAIGGITTQKIFVDFLLLIPVILFGTLLGSFLFGKTSDKIFKLIVEILLSVIALILIFS
ncbi:MAG: sulfite exporter TauE/SafE family protein [Melioribacteraceae bacterium]|nr:sulfite exporter TauE/SafE family protein [Melioribacteraceae bacterium]MCF8263003.1 sulfite exporter TauE/SafE family protein [Melioribacteraceae bacterium]MCF8413997.1 sulfite exporter TauE/SafE family protein [Melioribacteraceae bacterium]MCF8430448.1 sulfite exporter TauE/SafE family protein [Melioribacteraceae bacterium]